MSQIRCASQIVRQDFRTQTNDPSDLTSIRRTFDFRILTQIIYL